MNFRLPALTACAAATLVLSACGGGTSTGTSGQTVTIRVGNIYAQTTTYGKALDKMAEDVKDASGGSIKLQIFHGGAMGSEKEHIEAVREGSLEMMESGTAGIGLFVPETSIFELWYANDNIDTLVKAFSNVQLDLEKLYADKGFQLLGAYFDGPRSILSTKEVNNLGEVKGLKLRVPDSPLYVSSASALGARAVTMPLGDVYTGLQTGAIDAMEGTPDSVFQAKLYENAKYYIMDSHVFQPLSIVYNKAAWDKLTADQQKILRDAVTKSSKYHLSLIQKANEDALAAMKESGVKVIEIKDRDQWSAAVEKTNQDFAGKFGAAGQQILTAMNSAKRP